jgi:hypothetical protein
VEKNYIMRSLMICTAYQIFFRLLNREELNGAHIAGLGEKRGAYRVLVGKEPLGRLRRRWEDNIKINFQGVEWGHGLN